MDCFTRKSIFPICLVLLLFLPLFQGITKIIKERPLYGYTDPIIEKPKHYVSAFFNKELQAYIEQYANIHLGFRAFLIRTYHEINYRIFKEVSGYEVNIVSKKRHGLYSDLSLNYLNYQITHKKELEQQYQEEAKELIKVQKALEKHGKYFAVIIASSKTYIYPEELSSRYLIDNDPKLFNKLVSFGDILKATGVHVIDSGPMLRELVHASDLETHSVSGVHWNNYAGCIIANQLVENLRKQFPIIPKIDCGVAQRIKPPLYTVDRDGYLLLNLWFNNGLLKLVTYPSIAPLKAEQKKWQPKIVFIGDSFSDQILAALKETGIYSRLVVSSYFKTRAVENSPPDEKFVAEKLLADINDSDIVILEMVDYNLARRNYGFANFFLKKHKEHLHKETHGYALASDMKK